MIRPLQIYDYKKNKVLIVNTIKDDNIFCSVIDKSIINESFMIPDKFITIKKDKFFFNLIRDIYTGYCDRRFFK